MTYIIDWIAILAKPLAPKGYQDSESRKSRNQILKEAFPDVRLTANNFSNNNGQACIDLKLSAGGWLNFSEVKAALLTLEPNIIARADGRKMFGVTYANMQRYGPAELWLADRQWHAQVAKHSNKGMWSPKVFSSTDLYITLQLLFRAIYGDIK